MLFAKLHFNENNFKSHQYDAVSIHDYLKGWFIPAYNQEYLEKQNVRMCFRKYLLQ